MWKKSVTLGIHPDSNMQFSVNTTAYDVLLFCLKAVLASSIRNYINSVNRMLEKNADSSNIYLVFTFAFHDSSAQVDENPKVSAWSPLIFELLLHSFEAHLASLSCCSVNPPPQRCTAEGVISL